MGRKERTVLIAIGANVVLIVLRFFLARISGSIALKASAWHSFSDIFISLFVLTGFIVSRIAEEQRLRRVSRIENIIAICVSFFIFGVGVEIFREVVGGDAQELSNVPVVILWSFVTVVICYFMSRYKVYVGQQTNSASLIADGYHSRLDVYSSLIVIVGLIGYLIGFVNLDKVAALIVVLFIFSAGWESLSHALKSLSAPDVRAGDLEGVALNQRIIQLLEERAREGRLNQGVAAVLTRIVEWLEQTRNRAVKSLCYLRKRQKLIFQLGFLILALSYLLSGVSVIGPDEMGVVRRFGKRLHQLLPSGLHYRLPRPIEIVDKVEVSRVQKMETGPLLLLTGDENLVKTNVGIHYQIYKPEDYLFKVSDGKKVLRQAARAAISQIIAERNIDDVITNSRQLVQNTTAELLQKILDKNQTGLRVVSVNLLDVMPPNEVLDAFRDVFSAREDKEAYINEAYSYANKIIPEARGKAEQKWKLAEGYRAEKINSAAGEAARFENRLKEYAKAKGVTRTRLHLEAMEKVLPGVKKFIVDSEIISGSQDLWFIDENSKTRIVK